jgi:DNA-binding Lrp family transcriptional regulator
VSGPPESPAAAPGLDRVDTLILNLLQDDFPISPRPYRELARRLAESSGVELSETELLARVNALRDSRHVRRLGAILDSAPLGYRSTLCAVKTPDRLIGRVTALINQRPEVTHNYVRAGDLNVWFTFCHHDRRRLDELLAELRSVEGLGPVLELPARKVYKIRAVFELPAGP